MAERKAHQFKRWFQSQPCLILLCWLISMLRVTDAAQREADSAQRVHNCSVRSMVGTVKSTAYGRCFTPDTMRDVLGSFCSGVVIVTAVGDEPLGFTCQSFASLSLNPPLISFSPSRTSTTWPRIRDVGAFCINVLAEDHPHLSTKFARSGTDKYADVNWRPTPHGSPILDGVVAWIDCTLWAEHDGGDHTVVVGEVHDLAADLDQHPLLFYRGNYPTHLLSPPETT